MSAPPLISIVVPCYDEEENLPQLFVELEALFAERADYRFEVITVDDGSRDGTLAWLRDKADAVDYLRVLSFAGNFGSHSALLAGARAARGDAVTALSADLQDPPELVVRLAERWRAGVPLVWGVRAARNDSLRKRATSYAAHRVLAVLARSPIPASGLEIFLADRQVVDAVCAEPWRHRSVIMAFYLSGVAMDAVPYAKRGRLHGTSKWTFRRRLRLFAHSIGDVFIARSELLARCARPASDEPTYVIRETYPKGAS